MPLFLNPPVSYPKFIVDVNGIKRIQQKNERKIKRKIFCKKYKKIYVYNMEADNFSIKVFSFTDTISAGIYEDLSIDFSTFLMDTF